MIKPRLKKIASCIALIRNYAKDRNYTVPDRHFHYIMFYSDVAHLDKYGRPIGFDTYYTTTDKRGPIGQGLERLLPKNCIFDKGSLSRSDTDTVEDVLGMYMNYPGFIDFVHSINHIDFNVPASYPGKFFIPMRDLLYPGKSKEEIEELEFLWAHSGTDKDFVIPDDLDEVTAIRVE